MSSLEVIDEIGGTQKGICQVLGYNDTHLSDVFGERRSLSDKFLKRLQQAYGYRADYILHGTGPKKADMMERGATYNTLIFRSCSTEALLAEVGRRLDALLAETSRAKSAQEVDDETG